MTKRAALHTLGCRLNQAETNIICERLELAGYAIVPFGEPADLGIINTCTVTNEADAKSRKTIRSFIRSNPDAFTAIIGCYSQVGAHAIAEIEGVDLIVGNQEKLNLLDYVSLGKNGHPLIVCDRIDREDFTIDSTGVSASETRPNLKIQDGCDFMCSFCIIPFARGRARSRALPDLFEEAERRVEQGAKELVLTGVNIGTYDSEGETILGVIDRLNDIDALCRIRISSIEPTTIPEEFFERMNDPAHALVPHLHIPMQSGSNRVLERMRRRYTREDYVSFINRAADSVPNICIGTDILVGMPGESDDDFAETCDLVEHGPIAYAHIFKFSERDGTAAARMGGKIAPEIKNRRSAVVRQLSAKKLDTYHRRYTGREVDVLFEQREGAYWTGYTENFIRVAAMSEDWLGNEVACVRISENRGEFVHGSIVNGAYSV